MSNIMGTKDLMPLKPKGDPRSDAIRAKLKGSSSDKRKKAQQLNAICRMSKETLEKRALNLVLNEDLSAFEIERLILEMLKQDIEPNLRARLIDTAIKAHTAFHGTKTKNLNVNIDITTENVLSRLQNWKEEQVVNAEIIEDENKTD